MSGVTVDVSKLNDLRKEIGRLLQEAQRLSSRNEAVLAGVGRAVPIVIVYFGDILTVCYRHEKSKDDTEVTRITKTDAEAGPTEKRFDIYVNRVARFLEKRGLYQSRSAITDKTPSLFEEEK